MPLNLWRSFLWAVSASALFGGQSGDLDGQSNATSPDGYKETFLNELPALTRYGHVWTGLKRGRTASVGEEDEWATEEHAS